MPIALGMGFGSGNHFGLMLFRPSCLLVTAVTVCISLYPLRWRAVRHVPAVLQALLAATGLHWLILSALPLADCPTVGDLIAHFPDPGTLFDAFAMPNLGRGELLIVAKFALAIAMAAALETLATTTQLEMASAERSSGNAVLRRLGLAYVLLSPLLMPVAASLGRSISLSGNGGQTRNAQFLYAALLIGLATLGQRWIALLPQAAIAGVLIVVARNMLGEHIEQAYRTWRTTSDATDRLRNGLDLAVLILVALTTVADSFITGLAIGTIAAMGLFIRDQSRSVLRHVHFGDVTRSLRVRSEVERQILLTHGKEIAVIEAEGVLFFGSMDRLVMHMDQLAEQATTLILDLRRVTDIDRTASQLVRIAAQRYRRTACPLLLSHVPAERTLHGRLRAHGVEQDIPPTDWYPDLDLALECAETGLLRRHGLTAGTLAARPLAESDLVLDLSPQQIAVLEPFLKPLSVPAGQPLFRQGDHGSSLFVVTRGAISIRLGQQAAPGKRLISIGPGAVFGEMALITGAPRSADALADEDSALLELDRSAFSILLSDDPDIAAGILRQIAAELAGRLRDTTRQLRDLERD
jgi:MFS superfamily sulfate permease-like transporter/CRP-like cAMP-binding protein